ncbi:hypothetical protein [Lacinutrix sp. MEBiC02595]
MELKKPNQVINMGGPWIADLYVGIIFVSSMWLWTTLFKKKKAVLFSL